MFDGIIFDFDGVILDSEPLHYRSCHHALKKVGISLSVEEFDKKYLGLADKDLFPLVLSHYGKNLSPSQTQELINDKINDYVNLISTSDDLPTISGAKEYIEIVSKENKQLAICSGSSRKEILTILNKIHDGILLSYFKTITSSDDVKQGKPSPEGYLLTAKRLNLSPSRCLVIEDSPHGVNAAKEAGMYVIALLTTYSESQLAKADMITKDFNTLLAQHN